tara:strand:- start:8 stop:460 length:453 start_codon:yes stop_codon:yes gene_type:complete
MTENEQDTRQMTLDEWIENAPSGDDFEAREYIESRIIEEALEIVSRPIFKEPWMDNVTEIKVWRGNPYSARSENPNRVLWETTKRIEDPRVRIYGSFRHALDSEHWYNRPDRDGWGLGPIGSLGAPSKPLVKLKGETWEEAVSRRQDLES